MKRALVATVLAFSAFAAPALAAQPNSELKVGTDGVFSAKNILLYQKSGSALYSRAVWGEAFVRMTVLVNTNTGSGTTTQIIKTHGGTATLDDLQAGDMLAIEGTLQTGADSLFIIATKITDYSLNQEPKTFSGTIKSVHDASFVLPVKSIGNVTINVGTSTITKGVRTIAAADLKAGDKVLKVEGSYDFNTNTLAATNITIYQDPSVFKPRVFVGTVRELPGTTLPTTLVVSAAGQDYQVFLSADAKVINKSYAATQLSRFAVGDSVRLYGSIRQDNLSTIDATILRDLNF